MNCYDILLNKSRNFSLIAILLLSASIHQSCKKPDHKPIEMCKGFDWENHDCYLPDDERFQYIGRFDFREEGKAVFAHSSSTIRFKFYCTSFHLLLKNHSPNDRFYNENYFNLIIDDQPVRVFKARNDGYIYSVTNLPEGEHTVTLFKRTEAACGIVEFYGVCLNKKAKLLPPPPLPERKIEFIGNSITSGYGVEAKSEKEKFSSATENTYLSYAAVAARLLDAQFVTVCFSGKGVFRNATDTVSPTLPKLYNRIYPQKTRKYDFSRWQPNVVVINLGTNDFSEGIPDSVGFIHAYVSFLSEIRKNYPGTVIILVDGPVMSNNWPLDKESGMSMRKLSTFREYLRAVKYSCGLKHVYLFSLSPQGNLGYGADWHPNIEQQKLNGVELAKFISSITGWKIQEKQ